MSAPNAWKTDFYKFVGQSFDYHYADRLNRLLPVVGEVDAKSTDYELTGTGGFGLARPYNGNTLEHGSLKRGFKTILTAEEYVLPIEVGYKEAKVDKLGLSHEVGKRIGESMAMTVYAKTLEMFSKAFDANVKGGDGKSWAATDHPNASKGSTGRQFIPDPDAGTYSNLITDALSISAITKAQAQANRFVTPDGLPFLCQMDTLLVSPELEATAKQICGDDARLYPDQADHVNPCYDMQYIVVGGGNFGFGAKQWAVCDRRLMQSVTKIVYNTRPTVWESQQDNPLMSVYTGYVDLALGWGDGRQIIFSKGT